MSDETLINKSADQQAVEVQISGVAAALVASLRSPATALGLRDGVLVAIGLEGTLTVSSRSGQLMACEVLIVGARPEFRVGDKVLYACVQGAATGIILGCIGRYQPRTPEAKVTIEATESLTLKCGAASIDLRADGKVMVRGEDVLLRAKGTQRIRAGTVSIN